IETITSLTSILSYLLCFVQAEDGIRDFHVTGVQTCALPIWENGLRGYDLNVMQPKEYEKLSNESTQNKNGLWDWVKAISTLVVEIGRASCRERVESWVVAGGLKREGSEGCAGKQWERVVVAL